MNPATKNSTSVTTAVETFWGTTNPNIAAMLTTAPATVAASVGAIVLFNVAFLQRVPVARKHPVDSELLLRVRDHITDDVRQVVRRVEHFE